MNAFESAAQVFWGHISESFPEVKTGDSQLSGEDLTALGQWALGVRAAETLDTPSWEGASEAFALSETGVDRERFERATSAAIEAAGDALKTAYPDLGAIPDVARETLRACVRSVLFWNFPRPDDGSRSNP